LWQKGCRVSNDFFETQWVCFYHIISHPSMNKACTRSIWCTY
jgi:hypothetical protein